MFRLLYGEHSVTVALRPGFVTDEFIELTRRHHRTAHEERRLDAMKAEMAARVMAAPAGDVYEVDSAAFLSDFTEVPHSKVPFAASTTRQRWSALESERCRGAG